jgi:serine protease Do
MNVTYSAETVRAKMAVIYDCIPVINLKLIAVLCVLPFGILHAKGAPDSFADLAAKLLPSVVNISTMQTMAGSAQPQQNMPKFPPGSPFEEFFKDFKDRNGLNERGNDPNRKRPRRRAQSLGSGFIIDKSGIIVTNNHVIAEADEIKVRLQDDTEFDAIILGRDPKTDIAVLKIKPGKTKLTAVEFGDSRKLRVGDWVVAIGNPFGLGGTVTAGIVSARGRDINQGPYDDFIQTDASINKGNSGGPLFDLNGKVIGINTAIFSQSGGSVGIGFAVASRLAKPVVSQLTDFGRTRRGWLGVRIQMVTNEIAESFGLKNSSGALVAEVSDNGPAQKAGIKPGDIILKFNNQNVETMRRLPRIVAETPIGIDVPVVVWRSDRKKNVTVRIGELKENIVASKKASKKNQNKKVNTVIKLDLLGIALSVLDEQLKKKYTIAKEAMGVVVVGVDPDGLAAEKGIRAGDVIAEVDQKLVTAPSAVIKIVDRVVQNGKKKSVLFTINRQGAIRFMGVRLK